MTELAGVSALVAAAATLIGAVTLGLFFTKGQPWGTINDIASIVLMLATIPVAVLIAMMHGLVHPLSIVTLGIGTVGMVGASVTQGMLVAKRRTYEQLLPWTLGFGAVVGVWYILVGVLGPGKPLGGGLDLLAIVSGVSFIALGYGFLRGNERHPLSIIGGVMLLFASTWFFGWLGLRLLTGQLGIGVVA